MDTSRSDANMTLCEDSDSNLKIFIPFFYISTRICVKELARVYGNSEDYDLEEVQATLVEDAIEAIRKREKRLMKTWINHMEHEGMRKAMVHYICAVCVKFKLSRATAALAIHIFNYFQDSHNIVLRQMYTVALTCLAIASKIHQRDIAVCRMRALSRTIPERMTYSAKLFRAIEKIILEYFKLEMIIPTVNDFIDTYSAVALEDVDIFYKLLAQQVNGVTSEDGNTLLGVARDDNLLAATLRRDLRLLASDMTNVMSLLLDEEPSNKFPPSLIAAAILLLTRLKFQFQRWCGYLERITGYPHEDVVVCINEYVLASEDVKDFLDLDDSVVITSEMLETDEFVIQSIFDANVYPEFIMIGGQIRRKPLERTPEKKCDFNISSSSSSSGCGGTDDTSTWSVYSSCSISSISAGTTANPMFIPSS